MPFATAKEIRMDEKLPGPEFTRIEKSVQRFTLYFFIRFNIFITN